MENKNIKFMKTVIATFFLIVSFWMTYLIFNRGFIHKGMEFSPDSQTENTFMILLIGTLLSACSVFFMGVLSMFTHFVFVKLIYADDIKQGAFYLLKRKAKNEKESSTKKPEENITTLPLIVKDNE